MQTIPGKKCEFRTTHTWKLRALHKLYKSKRAGCVGFALVLFHGRRGGKNRFTKGKEGFKYVLKLYYGILLQKNKISRMPIFKGRVL
jgi:hypothetical protein